jgi:HAD superfamily hydrolase (TIGR01484 family)
VTGVRPLPDPSGAEFIGVRGVFCDIDDTLTWHGRLVPEAFLALHRLQAAGFRVVPITGRPGGWVDQIARLWPVDGVVGENGGLWFWQDGSTMERRFLQDADERATNRTRLDALARRILVEVPGAALASDQPYRDLDLAIDFCEDVPRLPERDVDRIVELFEDAGCTAKVSSIHVNGWFGAFDKRTGCRRFLADRWSEDLEDARDRWVFVGDSANDEPMFEYFPRSVGVANVAAFLGRMRSHPTFVTPSPGGHGFAELVDVLIAQNGGSAP